MLKKSPELDTNPIYQRLTRDSSWPDDRAARWLIVGVVGAGLLIDLAAWLIANPGLTGSVMWLGWISLLVTPAISAVVAVSIVTHDLQKEDFQMVRLTLATDKSLLHGYSFAALHRLRALLISTRSLIPSLIVLGVTLMLQNGYPFSSTLQVVMIVLVGIPLFMITARQFSEMGAALGITLALWWQHPIPAAVGASMIMLIAFPIVLGLWWWTVLMVVLAFTTISLLSGRIPHKCYYNRDTDELWRFPTMFRVEFKNPIMKRLVRRINWPSLQVTRLIAIAAGLAGLGVYLVIAWQIARSGGLRRSPLDDGVWLVAWGLMILAPVVMALVAATITAHDVSQPEHQLLRLTPLSAPKIVKGYTMAVAWRMRVPLAILFGLSPILLIGPSILAVGSASAIAIGITAGLMLALVATFQLAIVWMASLLGLYVGIWAGLKWQNVPLATAAAPVIILIPMAITGWMVQFTGGICGALVASWMVFMLYAVHARVEKTARVMFP